MRLCLTKPAGGRVQRRLGPLLPPSCRPAVAPAPARTVSRALGCVASCVLIGVDGSFSVPEGEVASRTAVSKKKKRDWGEGENYLSRK